MSETYFRPSSLPQALDALALAAQRIPAAPADRPTLLAGGTDVYPVRTQRQAWFEPFSRNILDLTGLAELGGIREDDGQIVFGALTTWSEIIAAALPPAFDGLKLAAGQVGGVQIQNRGTIAGNLCNASPAADGVPPLMALDASVELASVRGTRRLPLAQFILGNRKTALAPDELVTTIRVPKPAAKARSTFLKLGSRSYLVISIASVAAVVETDEAGQIAAAKIAVGACSAVPQRLFALEARLAGRKLGDGVTGLVEPGDLEVLAPIDDVRASGAYRREAALVLVRRVLSELIDSGLEDAA